RSAATAVAANCTRPQASIGRHSGQRSGAARSRNKRSRHHAPTTPPSASRSTHPKPHVSVTTSLTFQYTSSTSAHAPHAGRYSTTPAAAASTGSVIISPIQCSGKRATSAKSASPSPMPARRPSPRPPPHRPRSGRPLLRPPLLQHGPHRGGENGQIEAQAPVAHIGQIEPQALVKIALRARHNLPQPGQPGRGGQPLGVPQLVALEPEAGR